MRSKSHLYVSLACILAGLLSATAWADQIMLKDGTVYSGKFVRGDSGMIDFRILGRIESFSISEIDQIIFRDSEPGGSATIQSAPAQDSPIQTEPAVIESQRQLPAVNRESPQASVSGSEATFPAGTPLVIRTSAEINTERNRVGDVFDATLDEALVAGERTVFPRGTTVKGKIAYARESGKISGQPQLILELTDLVADGQSFMLRTSDYQEVGASRGKRTAATVGGTAALGAIIGAIAGGGTGAAVGAASGAAVGTGVQVLTKGEVLRIPAETVLEFKLESPLKAEIP